MPTFPDLDFERFHTADLPARIAAGNGRIAAADLSEGETIALRLAGHDGGYTYRVENGTLILSQ